MTPNQSLYAGRDALVALTNALHVQHEKISQLEKENTDLKRLVAQQAEQQKEADRWREEAIQRMEWEGGAIRG